MVDSHKAVGPQFAYLADDTI